MYSLLANIMMLLDAAAAAQKVGEIISTMIGPVLTVLGGAGAIYMVVLGVQYAKAEDDNKRLEVKKRLINIGIGIGIIFVLATLCLALDWEAIAGELFGAIWNEASGTTGAGSSAPSAGGAGSRPAVDSMNIRQFIMMFIR